MTLDWSMDPSRMFVILIRSCESQMPEASKFGRCILGSIVSDSIERLLLLDEVIYPLRLQFL